MYVPDELTTGFCNAEEKPLPVQEKETAPGAEAVRFTVVVAQVILPPPALTEREVIDEFTNFVVDAVHPFVKLVSSSVYVPGLVTFSDVPEPT
jgi:hypothetical protein